MSTTSDSRRHSNEADERIERSRDEAGPFAGDADERDADAAGAGAEDLQSGGEDAQSGYGYSMATLMRRLAGGLQENDIDEFARELSEYARRSPGVFLAGSVALGFGITRFLKASSGRSDELDQRYELDYEGNDYDGHEEDYDFDSAFEPSPAPEVSRRSTDEPWPAETNDPGRPERGSAAPSSGVRPPAAREGDAGRQAGTEGEHPPAATGSPSERVPGSPGDDATAHGGNAHG